MTLIDIFVYNQTKLQQANTPHFDDVDMSTSNEIWKT